MLQCCALLVFILYVCVVFLGHVFGFCVDMLLLFWQTTLLLCYHSLKFPTIIFFIAVVGPCCFGDDFYNRDTVLVEVLLQIKL